MPGPAHRDDDRLSPCTLLAASLSSAAAAVVVHEFWRAGAILGAAVTPVIVALLNELPLRPTRHVRVPVWRQAAHRRQRWWTAIATGLLAFQFGAAGLTAAETLLSGAVTGTHHRTTVTAHPSVAQQR